MNLLLPVTLLPTKPIFNRVKRLATNRRLTVPSCQPLLAYLLGTLGQKRGSVKNLLKFGAVQVNGTTVKQFDHSLVAGDVVTVGSLTSAAAKSRLEQAQIRPLYEDEALLVVDKPSGLLSVATDQENLDTLFVHLNEYLQDRDPESPARALVVHRLDQETSGLMLFAKDEAAKQRLQTDWPKVEKVYLALVLGTPAQQQGTVTNYLTEDSKTLKVRASQWPTAEARQAITHYRVVESQAEVSLVECRIETGRKHQIRVHLAGLGCPLLGDRRYGQKPHRCLRLALHASEICFTHPTTGERMRFVSPLPPLLRKLLS